MSEIRRAMARLDMTEPAHLAADEPAKEQIYSPRSHAAALDFARSLVVGNRGVGKSFWSAVLAHRASREHVAASYPRLLLDKTHVELGFHEAAGKRPGIAPSPAELLLLLQNGFTAEQIWQGVLVRGLIPDAGLGLHSITAATEYVAKAPLDAEKLLVQADQRLFSENRRYLLVFDALDRLASDWTTIRELTRGLLKVALDSGGYLSVRLKIFMRVDQAADDAVFRFQDSSKIRTTQVKLTWERRDLYGMLFQKLARDEISAPYFEEILSKRYGGLGSDIWDQLLEMEPFQADIFYQLAGEFMGADARRGRTYSWLHGHLADAFEETSPRSFLTAIRTAAERTPSASRTALDPGGLKAGVQAASAVRVEQLKEDYNWIRSVLRALEGLEVPCHPAVFEQRWIERGTIKEIEHELEAEQRLGPVEFQNEAIERPRALLRSLETLGVIESRSEDKINMPDLFRVEARIKRRGGVRPPSASARLAG